MLFKHAIVIAVVFFATDAGAEPRSKNSVDEPVTRIGSQFGTSGIYRLEGAVPLRAGDLLVGMGGYFSSTDDFFEKGDHNDFRGGSLHLTVAPVRGFELAFSGSATTNRNSAFAPRSQQTVGDPQLLVKYVHEINDNWFGGLRLGVRVPTSAQGRGLSPSATSVSVLGVASYRLPPAIVFSANAGYVVDRSENIFKRPTLAVERFAAGISTTHYFVMGGGAEAIFSPSEHIVAGPFMEVVSHFSTSESFQNGPTRLTGGLKVQPFGADRVDLLFGGDVRLTGKPDTRSAFSGLMPWAVFGRIALHAPLTTTGAPVPVCASDGECTSGQQCVDGVCVVVKEVVKEMASTTATQAPETYWIEGIVIDQTTTEPIRNALISLSGFEESLLAVDYKTGKFHSWPLPSGDGLLQLKISAPGYRPLEQTFPKGHAGEAKTLTLKLQASNELLTGVLKGSLRDSENGKALKGQLVIPALNVTIPVADDGAFEANVKAGRYHVLISGPGKRYITQKKDIEIRAGDTVILNIDLTPKRR